MHIAIALLAVLSAIVPGSDRVTLQDKKVLEGRVVHEGRDSIVLRHGGKDTTIPRTEVSAISSLERSLAPLLTRDLRGADVATLSQLATEAAGAGLTADSRNLWLRVLLAEPGNEAARKAVEGRGAVDDPLVTLGKHQHKLSALRATQPKWSDAYLLATTHFEIRTDVALDRALDIGIALERFHKTFYDLLGEGLTLYVFDEKQLPEVRVYGSGSAYPAPPAPGPRAWFGELENCLHVRADEPVRLSEVVSVLARQMLFTSLRRSEGPTANLPAWVASGIETYLARSVPAQPGGEWPSPETPIRDLFSAANGSDLTFERLFRGVSNDFTDAKDAARMSACAYTLVHYLSHGEGGALRPGFGAYLREGARGKLSMKALTDAVGRKPEAIEAAWRAHVKQHAQ